MATAAKTERFELRLDPGTIEAVDAWRGRQADIPSRAEAVRRLVEGGLATPKERELRLSDGEKLIILMLCDIHKQMKIKGEIEPDFVAASIFHGSLWALGWEYTGIFHGREDKQATLHEVLTILDMWSFIEGGYSKLSKKEKDRVAAEADLVGKRVVFRGFDGNYESEHLGVAGFLIKQMGRFSEFKDRDLNSHCPLLNAYRRMTKVFEPMRANLIGHQLTASQIIEILKAEGNPDAQRR